MGPTASCGLFLSISQDLSVGLYDNLEKQLPQSLSDRCKNLECPVVEIQSPSCSPLLSKASGSLLESSQEPASGLSTRAVNGAEIPIYCTSCVWGRGGGEESH